MGLVIVRAQRAPSLRVTLGASLFEHVIHEAGQTFDVGGIQRVQGVEFSADLRGQ
jgi:hypothetical protein